MKYTLVIDQSTSATKAMLFSDVLELIDSISVEHRQYYPEPGWVEHDPEEILHNTYKAVELLLNQATSKKEDIASLAITNQRETVVVWNKQTGKPVYNAVVWQCNRGTAICRELIKQGLEEKVSKKTGLIINPYFSASGVQWILENVPDAKETAQSGDLLMGTVDSWLIWNLTGKKVHATDYTNASRTLLFNIHTLTWDNFLLDIFSIDEKMMPEVLPCDAVYGTTNVNNLLPEIPIAGVIGDSHGALAGQMCFHAGMGKATYGTGSSIMINIGFQAFPAPAGLVTSIGYAAKGQVFYAFEGNIHCTGATIKWLEDDLQLIKSADETEALATSVESTDGVYLVPAFTGLGAPWWDNDARAIICGMNRGTGKAHIVRAALESIAYQIKDLIELIKNSGVGIHELRVDGGPVRNAFLMQFQSDMLNAAIDCSPIKEASALGAAIMNGFALNKWKSFDEVAAFRRETKKIRPAMLEETITQLYQGWLKAIARARF